MNLENLTCGGAGVLKTIKFVMQLIDIVKWFVPIGLIIMISVDFLKNVIAGKEDEMRKNLSLAIKRLVFAVVIFLVPTIVEFAIGLLGDAGVDFAKCIELARHTDDFSEYEIKFEWNYDDVPETSLKPDGGLEVVPSSPDSDDSSRPNDDVLENGDDGSTGHSPGSDLGYDDAVTIMVGDSRFVGMELVLKSDDSVKWVSESGMGYDWLSNEAISTVKSMIEEDKKYNIVFNLGVNDTENASKYASFYNKMLEDDTYKNCKIIVVSVNPIDDNDIANTSYKVRNTRVIKFNSTVRNYISNKIGYCDTYSKIRDNMKTSDGLHYLSETSKEIYNIIMDDCL